MGKYKLLISNVQKSFGTNNFACTVNKFFYIIIDGTLNKLSFIVYNFGFFLVNTFKQPQ